MTLYSKAKLLPSSFAMATHSNPPARRRRTLNHRRLGTSSASPGRTRSTCAADSQFALHSLQIGGAPATAARQRMCDVDGTRSGGCTDIIRITKNASARNKVRFDNPSCLQIRSNAIISCELSCVCTMLAVVLLSLPFKGWAVLLSHFTRSPRFS